MLARRCRTIRSVVLLAGWLVLAFGSVKAHTGWGLCVSAEGEIYFADAAHERVWKINQRGSLFAVIKGKHVHGLWLDQAGNLVGEDVVWDAALGQWRHSQLRFNAKEKLVEVAASSLSEAHNTGFALDAAGNQIEVESGAQTLRLLKRTPTGQLILLAGGARGHADGPGAQAQFTLIEALTLGPDGALYLRDAASIRRVSPTGEVTTLGGNPLAGVAHGAPPVIMGLAVDARGNVFVADSEHGVVRKISPGQRVETVLTTSLFWAPAGVAVANDELYVLEDMSRSPLRLFADSGIGPYLRVRKVAADGNARTLATVWGTTTRVLLGALILLIALIALWRLRQREGHRELAG